MTESLLRYLEQPTSPRPKGIINLRAVTAVQPVSLPNATIGLEIRTPSRTYLLRYDSPADRDSWAASIEVRLSGHTALRWRLPPCPTCPVLIRPDTFSHPTPPRHAWLRSRWSTSSGAPPRT